MKIDIPQMELFDEPSIFKNKHICSAFVAGNCIIENKMYRNIYSIDWSFITNIFVIFSGIFIWLQTWGEL